MTSSGDGSWVIAVADGLGGRPGGGPAALVAMGAVPARIESEERMIAVFDAANAAVSASEHCGQTALAIAAWTPQDGILIRWAGDSLPFVLPVDSSEALRATGPVAGSYPVGGFPPPNSDRFHERARSLSAHELAAINDSAGEGVVVVVATDGLCDRLIYTKYEPSGWFGSLLSDEKRGNAELAADALIDAAERAGLLDNTAVAVAVQHTAR